MVVLGIIFATSVFLFLGYCMVSTFNDSNWDVIGNIRHDIKGFVKVFLIMIACLVVIWYCIVTPSSFINHQYVHKNGTMTVVEYSISGDSTTRTEVKTPVKTYGKVIDVKYHSHLNGKTIQYHTSFKVRLNDGRVLEEEWSGTHQEIKENNGMSITESFYPSYIVEYNFN